MRRLLLMLLFFITGIVAAKAQDSKYITGKVTDSATGAPIAGCSVYFSNTSKGDITTSKGEFALKNLPIGRYEMVFSAIGYETTVVEVTSNNYPERLQVKLQHHSAELSEVVVLPSLVNGWEKWGQTFLENFIGTTPNASYCRIKNREVIKFWFSEKNERLTARAEEPLVIENDALGYIIKFKLQEFSLDFNSHIMVYNGYPLFQEMQNDKKENKWKENRNNAYYGSLLQFMRCIYDESWHDAGYRIVTYAKLPNLERLRVKKIVDAITIAKAGDSAAFYKKVLKQPDSIPQYLELTELDSSMLVTDPEDGSKRFFFKDKLKIVYKRYPPSKPIQSEIYLVTPEPIVILENGNYFNLKELVTTMHWGDYEKIANLLPIDYKP